MTGFYIAMVFFIGLPAAWYFGLWTMQWFIKRQLSDSQFKTLQKWMEER